MTREDKLYYYGLLREKRRRIARSSLLAFTKYTMDEYFANYHHVEYAKKLDEFARGKIKKLMVTMPPQHGKSELSTRRLPAYLLGINPDLRIAIAGYSHTVVSKFNRDIQRVIDSEQYRELFPNTALSGGARVTAGSYLRNEDEFEIVQRRGSVITVGAGGGLTSRTVDIGIIDDIYKDAAEAWSETVRRSRQEWYDTVFRTRLHNDSQQLIVMTRWHEDDLCGELLRAEPDWEVVTFKAISDNGDALWPERHSLESLLVIKEQKPVVFESLYQQNPVPREGLLIAAADLKRFKKRALLDRIAAGERPDGIVAVCDVADTGADSLCAPVGWVYGNDVFVGDVVFTTDPIEITQPRVAAMMDLCGVDRARFESNNGGRGYALAVQGLIKGRTAIEWLPTTQNKHTRILMKSGYIKSNFYFLEDGDQDAEYQKFFYELTHYPKDGRIKHDDAIDGVTMLAEYTDKSNDWGF